LECVRLADAFGSPKSLSLVANEVVRSAASFPQEKSGSKLPRSKRFPSFGALGPRRAVKPTAAPKDILLGCVAPVRYRWSMTELESQILQALLELEQTVRALPASNPKPSLLPFFARVDTLAGQLPAEADPSLRHYLQKRSYEKARLLLEGRDGENQSGPCGHV
jgi:hypothetical protein